MTNHSERCKDCKIRIYELLTKLFGEVKYNHNLKIPNNLDLLKDNAFYTDLKKILTLLQKHGEYDKFIRAKRLPNVDYFVVNPGFILEFDESQHFTKPREITLKNYPPKLRLKYNKEKWIELCIKLHKKDKDPHYRDEQRAWYDTMRDFSSSILDLQPTIRLFAKSYVWCDLNPERKQDIIEFQNLLNGVNYEL